MKAKYAIAAIALGAAGFMAKKWLDKEVEKSREIYGDDYSIKDTLLDKFENGLWKSYDALERAEETTLTALDKLQTKITGKEVDHRTILDLNEVSPETREALLKIFGAMSMNAGFNEGVNKSEPCGADQAQPLNTNACETNQS
ncbi:hypothetical protein [Campylobacter devanensis]|uniref:hypothetical protein n=1 Tax=Campylobacter devanensis TaxID=3161138 RepID=UPI000A34EEA8|nr:hypothetical protein [Campylobacter sp. P0088]